jgi:hypothetical protein
VLLRRLERIVLREEGLQQSTHSCFKHPNTVLKVPVVPLRVSILKVNAIGTPSRTRTFSSLRCASATTDGVLELWSTSERVLRSGSALVGILDTPLSLAIVDLPLALICTSPAV